MGINPFLSSTICPPLVQGRSPIAFSTSHTMGCTSSSSCHSARRLYLCTTAFTKLSLMLTSGESSAGAGGFYGYHPSLSTAILNKILTIKFLFTVVQNPYQPHPASRSSNPCTSSAHSLCHGPSFPSRCCIISLTSAMLSSTLA